MLVAAMLAMALAAAAPAFGQGDIGDINEGDD
jgi:F0F1-type ATP synthase membrane subunit c/vacuolar-type H+-ATPase subunit K